MTHTNEPICKGCEDKLKVVHTTLQFWFKSMKEKFPTLHIAWGYRNAADQNAMFLKRLTKAKFPNSKHNKLPAQALDVFLLVDGKARFNSEFYPFLWAETQKQFSNMEWAGNWKSFKEMDHFQLKGDKNDGSSTGASSATDDRQFC